MRPTVDDLKQWRDGHLSYGRIHPSASMPMAPVVTGYGLDVHGCIVTVLKSWGRESGEIEYGPLVGKVRVHRYEQTPAGRALFGEARR